MAIMNMYEHESTGSSISSKCPSTPASGFSSNYPSTLLTDFESYFGESNVDVDQTKSILVTGGLGFIGSHTSLELLKAGYNVIIVDDLSNSYLDVFGQIKAAATQYFEGKDSSCPRAELYNIQYQDVCAMRAVLESNTTVSSPQFNKTSNIIGVIHFAAWKAVEESIKLPLKYYRNNVSGLLDLLTLLEEYDIRTFIFSSSAAVYGSLGDDSQLLKEEDCTHGHEAYNSSGMSKRVAQPSLITNPYGRSKYFGEAILSDLAISDPLWKIVGLRYFNPIGCDDTGVLGEDPRGTPSNLLPVIVKVMTGQYPEIKVFGSDWNTPDGTAMRDFIHVTDLARGHIAALSAVMSGRFSGGFRTYNLGTGSGYSVKHVVETMQSVSQKSIPMHFVEPRAGDVASSVASVDRAREELNWETRESLASACRDICNHLKIHDRLT